MNKEAIERIKGFCCEVTQEQWEELVMVAHDNGVNPSDWDEWDECYPVFFIDAQTNSVDAYGSVDSAKKRLTGLIPIPFTDFLAKLKGAEPWEPKAGEMVEGMSASTLHNVEANTSVGVKRETLFQVGLQ